MNKFKTILFDIDGTLLDFKASEEEALEKVFAMHNYILDEHVKGTYERINKFLWEQYELGIIDRNMVIYSRFVKLFEELGIDGDGIRFEDEYQELLGEGHALMDGAREVLEYLHPKYELYVVTNGVTRTQMKRLQDSKLKDYFKDIFVSEATGYQKPMKEYFDYCFERIPNLDLSKTIIIGDSLSSDIQGGNNASVATCWVNPDSLDNKEKISVDYEIKQLKELYSFL
ncbi:2-haloacid dehalogenase [Mobilisporobacter senegalensis]|uniref:2-haloacid dehalogenase n=1 Tax=Mobilisporobacter senegalensis TaxID=1329262 RepID=A0A3N1X5R7_9FIRM|nr:YjjG family noncanonical pyrimidine nucleotidase [Mobilisporobacter senegalensis]ROR22103.1 2-haloacid dehalogenase [Mobilisporobacter senegalensis]